MAVRSGRRIVGRSPGASLPGGLVWIVVTAVAAMAWPLFRFGIGAPDVAMAPVGEIPAVLGVLIWVFGVGAAIAATVCYRQRFLALLLIGATGLAVSLGFVLLSAPDLALTQLLVEIATISLIMVVLHFLPQSSPPELHKLRQWRDGIIAAVAGIGITVVAHAVMTRPGASIAPFYLDRALPEGGGTNAVNVIIVDFRGFDTLGEIVVLGMAGLIVFALLWNFRIPPAARSAEPTGPWNPLLVRTVARLLLPMATMVAIFLYLRGHNLPGGGFVAGLTMACALVALRIAGGGTRILDPRQLTYQSWVGGGLLAAGLTGVGSMLLGYPFLTTSFVHPVLPVIGELPLASAMFFDLGVFMTVVGATLLTTISPGLLPDGHIGEPPS
jgi:multicomponent K+:H+ antiporter subunit A